METIFSDRGQGFLHSMVLHARRIWIFGGAAGSGKGPNDGPFNDLLLDLETNPRHSMYRISTYIDPSLIIQ